MLGWQMKQQQQQMRANTSNGVIALLTTRQHLRPHQPLREVLQAAMDELGCCPGAIERAVTWLCVDASRPVGRLRRTELVQLANSICRFWRYAAAADAPAHPSAENSPR